MSSLKILADHYGVSEPDILKCLQSTKDIFDAEVENLSESIVSAIKDVPNKNLFTLLKKMSNENNDTKIECEGRNVKISGPFNFLYQVEEDGTINADLVFDTGKLTLRFYRGIIDEFDPFQEERRVFIDIGSGEVFETFSNGGNIIWIGIPPEARFLIETIPGLANAIDDRAVDVLIAEIISFGRYAKKC